MVAGFAQEIEYVGTVAPAYIGSMWLVGLAREENKFC